MEDSACLDRDEDAAEVPGGERKQRGMEKTQQNGAGPQARSSPVRSSPSPLTFSSVASPASARPRTGGVRGPAPRPPAFLGVSRERGARARRAVPAPANAPTTPLRLPRRRISLEVRLPRGARTLVWDGPRAGISKTDAFWAKKGNPKHFGASPGKTEAF